MEILITNRFQKKYLDDFEKYFSKEEFANSLKSDFVKFILLKKPFIKFKISINNITFRGIVVIEIGEYIMPICLFLKKDKKYGENIIWENKDLKKLIFLEFRQNIVDFENNNFKLL